MSQSYKFSCHFCDANIIVDAKDRVGSVACERCPVEQRRPLVICARCTLSWTRIANSRRRCRPCMSGNPPVCGVAPTLTAVAN